MGQIYSDGRKRGVDEEAPEKERKKKEIIHNSFRLPTFSVKSVATADSFQPLM